MAPTWITWTTCATTDATDTTTTNDTWPIWVTNATTVTTATSNDTWGTWAGATGSASNPCGYCLASQRAETDEERAVREERQAKLKREEQQRKRRSEKLLHRQLTRRQRSEHRRAGTIKMIGRDGKRYEIDTRRRMHNVCEIDENGRRIKEYCIYQTGQCPLPDNALAQKLLLETDPDAFKRIANVRELRVA